MVNILVLVSKSEMAPKGHGGTAAGQEEPRQGLLILTQSTRRLAVDVF